MLEVRQPNRSGSISQVFLPATIGLWLLVVVAGFLWAVDYDHRPGAAADVPTQWPVDSALAPCGDGVTVLMFLHPHCSCSRASIAELARITASCDVALCVTVVVVWPEDADFDWSASQLHHDVAACPAMHVFVDRRGEEAARFGGLTSGFTLAYDTSQRLIFEGGITASRGHFGPSRAGDALLATIASQVNRDTAPVFGCPLWTPCTDCE